MVAVMVLFLACAMGVKALHDSMALPETAAQEALDDKIMVARKAQEVSIARQLREREMAKVATIKIGPRRKNKS